MRARWRWGALAPLLAGAAAPAGAGCGLEGCPSTRSPMAQPTLSVEVRSEVGQLRGEPLPDDHPQADYDAYFVAVHLRPDPRWRLGVSVLAARIRPRDPAFSDGEGMGNPVVHAELFPPSSWLSVGMQVEIPVGDDETGVADDHWAILPYLRLPAAWGWFDAMLLAGVRLAVTGRGVVGGGPELLVGEGTGGRIVPGARHGGGHAPFRLSRHGDDELVLRGMAGVPVGWGMRAGGVGAAEVVLGDETPDSARSLGVWLEIPAGAARVTPWAEWGFPEKARRFERRIGLSLHLDLG